ncbi:prostaglandin F2 receptor negative regulator isoform X2 [Mixophyes fleayi]|uniref:prostaglandin F2 receptor negative regulator isoform X2 n=1 Tax=Mixophyes fleayi TaxID=3061075 RepID=UPI003F4DD8E2
MRSPVCLLLLLLLDVAWSRIVSVPSSPLLRVEGTDVSIACSVTEYEGPSEQNFDWTFSSGSGGAVEVLSTWDNTFTHSSFSRRVQEGGIKLQRVSNNVIHLHIHQLRTSDAGNYTCSTPSTDATFSGNYDAHVQLRVISDTLRLGGPKGRLTNVRNVTEGGSLQLRCQASFDNSAAHTHLSLTWERQVGGSASEVLTLTHLGRFQPGSEYDARYSSGAVRLDTTGADMYQLTVDGVQPSDAGEYSCVAGSWVQGPDGWEKIQEKRVSVALVEVQAIDLSVTIAGPEVDVMEGSPFVLTCRVSLDSDVPLITRVRWFGSNAEELSSGPDPDPTQENIITYQLQVPEAWEAGEYTCRATAWALLANRTWHPVAEKMSTPTSVRTIKKDLSVSLNTSVTPQMSEEPTELLCHSSMSGDPHLSVSWYFTPSQGQDTISLFLGSLSHDWSLRVGEHYQQRLERGELIFSRRGPHTFVLRIQWTSEEDRGNYHCVVTAWKPLQNNSWVPAAEVTSKPVNVFWLMEDPALTVKAGLIKMVSVAGGTFEMMCTVQAQNIPSPQYSVQVTRTPPQHTADPTTVITLSRDGTTRRKMISVSNTVLEKGKEGAYLFRLYQAQNQDVGTYHCTVAAWTQGGGGAWRMVHNRTSNPVQLEFQTSGPVFNVTARSDSLSIYRGERSEFWCIITIDGPAVDPEDLAFEVSWYVQRPGGSSVFLVAADRMAQVRHNRRNSSSDVALERLSDMEYRLRIYSCEEEDAGSHYCMVTPWVRGSEGSWNSQETITSSYVSLSVRMDLLSAFRYPLLIGVGLSLLAGLLSCLIGYCSSRFCCKAQPVQEKRREHRRLMSMEMD